MFTNGAFSVELAKTKWLTSVRVAIAKLTLDQKCVR